MRENGLLAPARAGSPRGPRSYDGTARPRDRGHCVGTDLTTASTGDGPAAVLVAFDHRSAECASMLMPAPPGSRSWNQSTGACVGISAASPRAWCARRRGAPRSRLAIHVGNRVPRGRTLARLRPCPGRKRLRRALHPDLEGKSVVGAIVRDHRGAGRALLAFRDTYNTTRESRVLAQSRLRRRAGMPPFYWCPVVR